MPAQRWGELDLRRVCVLIVVFERLDVVGYGGLELYPQMAGALDQLVRALDLNIIVRGVYKLSRSLSQCCCTRGTGS